MRKKLNQKEVAKIQRYADKLTELWREIEDNDVELQIRENGNVSDQLSCAVAALDTILQEYE
jgi:hypothetical protein